MAFSIPGPRSRRGFRDYCLRKLGFPVIQINVSDEQIEDRIDDSLKYYFDYHFDGSEKVFFRYLLSANNRPGHIFQIDVDAAGTGYSNTDTLSFSRTDGRNGTDATAGIITDANGAIQTVTITNSGTNYLIEPTISITTSGGSGGSLNPVIGGFIPLPENIIGAINIFPIGSGLALSSNDIFSIRYQIALNDLYTLTAQSMIPYVMAMMHISLLEELLVGKIPIRYNRHKNRLYLDMDWSRIVDGNMVLIEAYEVVDPEKFTQVWTDRWLLRYGTAQIQAQWGRNLTKFVGMALPGGVQFNGKDILADAQREITELEKEMVNSYSLPVSDMIG
jgi:hypothetical protein